MSALLQSIAPEFSDLVATRGFVVVESIAKPEEFGNASVVLDSSALKLRIYTDRGQRFVDIGRHGTAWHKLEYVLEFLEPSSTQAWFGEPPDIGKLSQVLARNLDAVKELLSGDLDACGFTAFEKRKTENLLARIFGKLS